MINIYSALFPYAVLTRDVQLSKEKKKQEEKVCARVLFFTHALESQKTTNQQTNK